MYAWPFHFGQGSQVGFHLTLDEPSIGQTKFPLKTSSMATFLLCISKFSQRKFKETGEKTGEKFKGICQVAKEEKPVKVNIWGEGGEGLSNLFAPGPPVLHLGRQWFSGRMLACHAGGPGSIPG